MDGEQAISRMTNCRIVESKGVIEIQYMFGPHTTITCNLGSNIDPEEVETFVKDMTNDNRAELSVLEEQGGTNIDISDGIYSHSSYDDEVRTGGMIKAPFTPMILNAWIQYCNAIVY